MNKTFFYLPITLIALTNSGGNVLAQISSQGLDISNIDKSVAPGTDFYRYATGGWQDANPIPDEFSRYGSFDKLQENNQKQIKDLISELSQKRLEQGSPGQKIGDLYKMGLDSVKLNADGAAPLKKQLAYINGVSSRSDIIKLVAEIRRYASDPFFGIYVGADDINSSVNILQISQAGLGLGDRDYYVQKDKQSKKLLEDYAKLIRKQFVNAGYRLADAKKASDAVLKIENSLAIAHFKKEETRIPELNYHKLTVSQLNDSVAKFDWTLFFETAGLQSVKDLNVAQVKPLAAAVHIIETSPIPELKYYLSWCVINSASKYLSDNFVNADFEFFGQELSGAKVLQPRWKRTLNAVDKALGEEVGQLYVAKYFPAQYKERMLKLVNNLVLSLSERINGLEWMSQETKLKAQDKLNAFIIKVGYPDKWRDYSLLEIKNDSYWANLVRSSEFDYNYNIGKLGKPVDKSEWLMTPQTVNAYYQPTTNEICFPAGILQPPFFDMDADDAVNYGAIGVVIGHEMTHGFDDQGRKYDKNGNMTDWWTTEDAVQFEKRAKVLADYFSSILVAKNVHGNGVYTLGENIADHGGLQVSYNAFMKTEEGKSGVKIDAFTPQQRFFLSFANVWAGNIREAEIIRRTKMDPHALGKWRVDGALPHISAWYNAFHITANDPIYLPKEKRASIW